MLFEGFELERMPTLFALAGLFLTLIIVNGLFKFYINTYKGRLGERMLRRIRYDLVDKLLRFPVRQFRKVKSSEIASMVKDEVEPIGGFMGDAFVQPLFLGGQAITAMVFIMVQNVWLGLIAISMIAVQFVLIPRLRRHLIRLGKQRQIAARKLSGRVGEIVDGINHVHVNDTSHYERADVSSRLAEIFYIRYELFQRKFFAKFLNNLLAQFTPFLFYVIGGYFALQGKIDVGQLVAVIAAYKDLPSPIKELIDWDQQRLDVQVKFAQVVEQFDIEDMLDSETAEAAGRAGSWLCRFRLRSTTSRCRTMRGTCARQQGAVQRPRRRACGAGGYVQLWRRRCGGNACQAARARGWPGDLRWQGHVRAQRKPAWPPHRICLGGDVPAARHHARFAALCAQASTGFRHAIRRSGCACHDSVSLPKRG
jgi:ABC-type multidrug transport system fused ATPase/permease subunit